MALETNVVAGVGTVTIDLVGILKAVQDGGVTGAWMLEDDNGLVKCDIAEIGSNVVFSHIAKDQVDAIVTAFNAV